MKIVILFLAGLLFGCGSNTNKDSMNIAVAANMQFAMDSIVSVFEANYQIECKVTLGSSGMLTAQIENGAPYDLFFAANMDYPNYLHLKELGEKPNVYAIGRMILAVDKKFNLTTIDEVFTDSRIKRIGIADDRTAPYGIAARQFLNRTNRKENLKKQLIIGESINQVNQYLVSNLVDAAFTSYSFKVKNENKFTYFEIDSSYFEPIKQGVIVLNSGRKKHSNSCEAFINFVSSEKCKGILNHFGYLAE